MPKPKPPNELTAEIVASNTKRLSLQPGRISEPVSPFRKTKSQNFGKMKAARRPPLVPAIQEDNSEDEEERTSSRKVSVVVETEVRASKASKASRGSQRSSQTAYENQAFEGNLKRSASNATSIRTSSRAPSVQSLEVVREQYCCCAKRTKCERRLLTVILVLVIIVIVLVIVLAVIASDKNMSDIKRKLNL